MNWNIILVYPIRDEFYDDSNEDQCVATNHSPAPPAPPPAPQHALQPIMPEQHQQHAPPQEEHPPHDRPLLYIQLDKWTQQQRFATSTNRTLAREISRRDKQKQVARAKISKIYNVKIP